MNQKREKKIDEEMRSLRLRENSVTLGWTIEIDEERQRERERKKGLRKENRMNLIKTKPCRRR